MTNMRRSAIAAPDFAPGAVLADGLLSIQRPGGEVQSAVAKELFGLAGQFGQDAEQTAARRGQMAGEQAAAAAIPQGSVSGGDVVTPAVAGAPPSPASPQRADMLTARHFFERQGWTPVQASGIVGNLFQESTLRTGAANPRDPGTSIAIGQWNGERKAAFLSFARAQGKPWTDLNTQLAFVQHELMTSEGRAAAQLKGATSLDAATAAMIGYERPQGWTLQNPRGGNAWSARLRYAQQAYGDGTPAAMGALPATPLAVGAGGPTAPAAAPQDGTAVSAAGLQPAAPASADPVTGGDGGPARTPLSIQISGAPLQLTGRDTIYGRAFDQAASHAYLGQLQDEMLATTRQIYDKYKDNPAQLQVALEQLKQATLKDHVAPAIRADFELGYAKLQRAYLSDALSLQDGKQQKAARDAYGSDTDRLQEAVTRAAVGLDAANPDSQTVLAAQANQLKQHIQDSVARGYISQSAADEAKGHVDGQVLTALQLAQLTGKSPEEIKARRDVLKKDYAAGKLGLVYSDYAALDASLARATERAQVDAWQAREAMQGQVADDLASLTRTGQPLTINGAPLDPVAVQTVLGAKAFDAWQKSRVLAQQNYAVIGGMEQLTPEQMEARMTDAEPKPGEEHFAERQQLYDAAHKRMLDILQQRASDPASAADAAFPDLRSPDVAGDPARQAKLRLAREAQLGIAPLARSPLTTAEAQALANRLKLVEDDPAALDEAMKGLSGDVQKTYGPLGDEVMGQVLQQRGISKQTAQLGAAIVRQMGIGQMPVAGSLDTFKRMRSSDISEQAVQGTGQFHMQGAGRAGGIRVPGPSPTASPAKPKLPNAMQLELLRNQPDLAPQFDAKFGVGTAQRFLQAPRLPDQPARRTLPDGSVETRYSDGWIEVQHADGSIDGRQGP